MIPITVGARCFGIQNLGERFVLNFSKSGQILLISEVKHEESY